MDEFTEVTVDGGLDDDGRLILKMRQPETGVRIALLIDLTQIEEDSEDEHVMQVLFTMLKQSAEVATGVLEGMQNGVEEGLLMIVPEEGEEE